MGAATLTLLCCLQRSALVASLEPWMGVSQGAGSGGDLPALVVLPACWIGGQVYGGGNSSDLFQGVPCAYLRSSPGKDVRNAWGREN